jgi:hypothetical protein
MTRSALALANLRRFASVSAGRPVAERCGVCASEIPSDHHHLLERDTARLVCSCRACWLLFCDTHAARGTLRAIPDRVISVSDARVTAEQWEALQIPIALAFFRTSGATGQPSAFYPSPAGAIESQLPLDTWTEVMTANPWLRSVTPDVEAVLVRATAEGRAWYIVPIDACYELIGGMRQSWEGFSGGDGVRDQIDRFFKALDARSTPLTSAAGPS